MSNLHGKVNVACNVSELTAYFLELLIATLSLQRNFLASYHVKTFINNSIPLSFFLMKKLQMILDTINIITANIPVYI